MVTSPVSSLSLCRRWASIRPAVFVSLQRRLGWMRWSTRWPGHTGTWRSSTWSDRRKFSSFSLCLISTRSAWIVETLLRICSFKLLVCRGKEFPITSLSVLLWQLLNEYSWSPEDYHLWVQPLYFCQELKSPFVQKQNKKNITFCTGTLSIIHSCSSKDEPFGLWTFFFSFSPTHEPTFQTFLNHQIYG